MDILWMIYRGFNVVDNRYAEYILLIRHNDYSVSKCMEFLSLNNILFFLNSISAN
jgi:hypothetical protein